MRGLPPRRFGGGVGWGLATFTSRGALTRSSEETPLRFPKPMLEGAGGGCVAAGRGD